MTYYSVDTFPVVTVAPKGPALPGTVHIGQNLRNPARYVGVNLPATLWEEIAGSAPAQYAAILDATYKTAARRALSEHVKGFSLTPTSVPAAFFTPTALGDSIINGGNQWLSKEDLVKGWETSALLHKWQTSEAWKTSREFRTQVNGFSETVCKLSAKTAPIGKTWAERILAKMLDADMAQPWCQFVMRRCADILERPEAQIAEDLL